MICLWEAEYTLADSKISQMYTERKLTSLNMIVHDSVMFPSTELLPVNH